jgi:pyridinium-3,5-biscarboxylic acid mononucleotide sulfurtransferase
MMAELLNPLDDPEAAKALLAGAQKKLRILEENLRQLGSLMVAYSGGVDSAYLAATAYRVLGKQMVPVIADSPSLSRHDFEDACTFATLQGLPLRIIATKELNDPNYKRNDANRCFYCKTELFTIMKAKAQEWGFAHIAFGMNADDRHDYRPGQRAAQEQNVLAPLSEAGLNKLEVRALAREAGYKLWDRPAAPCLASRIAYGQRVTRKALAQVEQAEKALRSLGFRELRVRHHGKLARIEIARDEMPRVLNMDMMDLITASLQPIGFKYIALDCAGFRSGSLNAILPAKVFGQHGT